MNGRTESLDHEAAPRAVAGSLPLHARVAAWNRIWERLLAPPVRDDEEMLEAAGDDPGTEDLGGEAA
jgi:hypothetical protein